MYRFKKLLVAMDFSSADHSMLDYASHIAHLAGSAHIYFVHVADNFEIPDEIRKNYPTLIEPLEEFALRRMKTMTEQFFSDLKNIQFEFEVGEGDRVSKILNMIKVNDIDLVLVSKAGSPSDYSALGEKLARKAPCSVLIIPDGTQPVYKNVAVGCDFSENSLDAMDVAQAFTNSAGLRSFTCIHVYDIPAGYYKTGKSYEKFAEIMEKNAANQFMMMMKMLDMKNVNPELKLILDKKSARAMEKFVKNSDVDLLVLGARGRSSGAGILLGSVTEYLIRTVDIPILAVKKKGSGLDLLDAILNS